MLASKLFWRIFGSFFLLSILGTTLFIVLLSGQLHAVVSMESVDEQVQQLQRFVWGIALLFCFVAMIVLFFITRQILHPLRVLTEAAELVAAGNFEHSVRINRQDEIGLLATSFNSMTKQLAVRIGQFRDKQRELEEDSQLLQTVFGTMVEGVLVVDGEQKILFANNAAAELLEFSADSATGRPAWEVVRSMELQEVMENVLAGRPHEQREFRLARTQSMVALVASRLPGEPCPGIVLILYNITELHRLERLRQDFVSNVSHELKTPLTSIQAYAETLQNGAIDDPAHNRKFIGHIEEQAERLHSLILDLLMLARVESGEESFELASVPIAELLMSCADELSAIAASKSVSLICDAADDATIFVHADPEGVRTIFNNLINNAVNYTPSGGTVTLRCFVVNGDRHTSKNQMDSNHRMVRIDVIDTGIGIAHEHQPHIFERFYRAEKARSRELGGTGLGLAIVKHLAQVLGGTVEVESELEKGSTFSVFLPIA